MKKFQFLAIIASLTCAAGEIFVILSGFGFVDDEFVWTGMGLYFIGKGIFVGPMLISNLKD